MSFKRIMSLVAMGFLWTGSQIPVYLFGSLHPFIPDPKHGIAAASRTRADFI